MALSPSKVLTHVISFYVYMLVHLQVWNLGLPYPTFTLAIDDKPYLNTVSDDHSVKVKNVDWISKLPDDVLLIILSRLSTEEAIRTSVVSKRWEHVWSQMSHLVLDMRKKIINSNNTPDGSNPVATLITQVINNHRGHLESCVIMHVPYQGGNGMLNSWIRLLSCMKRTKVLTLRTIMILGIESSKLLTFLPTPCPIQVLCHSRYIHTFSKAHIP
ncbi:F-box domain [Arabidopsis suecica]|nr:F-box domain [Arabidopsis suecica]